MLFLFPFEAKSKSKAVLDTMHYSTIKQELKLRGSMKEPKQDNRFRKLKFQTQLCLYSFSERRFGSKARTAPTLDQRHSKCFLHIILQTGEL